MEIYKLKDGVPGGRVRGDVGKNESLIITDIKQGAKNPNRVNVYVDGEFAFSLDITQVVDYGVKVGLVLDTERLAELKEASEFGKVYQRALEWALMRPRSVQELRDYLKRRDMKNEAEKRKREWEREREVADLVARGEDVKAEKMVRKGERIAGNAAKWEKHDFSDLILERLCERGYVDDRRFAEFWVENRFVKKGASQKRLRMELMKKGVEKEIIDEVLNERDDEAEIRKMIERKRAKYDDDKLVAYLCRQGFAYDLVRRLVEESVN